MIRQNYDAYSKVAKEDDLKSITAYEVQKLAIAEEYKIFTNNKVVTMYRRGLAFLMSDIKGKYCRFSDFGPVNFFIRHTPINFALERQLI